MNTKEAIKMYNDFCVETMRRPDYPAIISYAKNELFESLPEPLKEIIAGAYARIERDKATVRDLLAIIGYVKLATHQYNNL